MSTDGSASVNYSVDINHGFRRVDVKIGISLLVALAKAEIFMPSACGGQGKCGFCKLPVQGFTGPLTLAEQTLLSSAEQSAGYRLACQIKPDCDVTVTIPEDYFGARRYTAKVTRKKLLTHDTVGLRIDLPPGKTIEYAPGQYVQFKAPAHEDKDAVLRAYSIATPPSEKHAIELIVKRVPGGICSTWVHDHLQEGMDVQFTGPYGTVPMGNSDAPLLLIAGGSGMAPVWGLLRHMRETGIRRKVFFFFGALTQKDLFLTDELRQMEKDMPGFTFIPALSNEPVESYWTGERGLITEVVDRHFNDCSGLEAYLCGSPGMINACLKVLEKNGMPTHSILFDKFG